MVLNILVALLLSLILILMIATLITRGSSAVGTRQVKEEDKPLDYYRDCPLCGTHLIRGETVHSHLYPGKPDGMMHIFGCPYCYDSHPKRKDPSQIPKGRLTVDPLRRSEGNRPERICPYCNKNIGAVGYVIARVFEKPLKTHVHVLGCTVCRKV